MSEEAIYLNFEDGKKDVQERHERWKKEAEERQLAVMPNALASYNEFCKRFAKQSNVARWLLKHRRTPDIVLLHDGHDIGMSISFRIPADDEPALLAWDLKPYQTNEWAITERPAESHPNHTFLRTTKALRTYHGPEGGSIGGSYFESGERETSRPLSRYAPATVDITCWCGVSRTLPWNLVLRNIERTTRPGHMRIENRQIVTTLPMS